MKLPTRRIRRKLDKITSPGALSIRLVALVASNGIKFTTVNPPPSFLLRFIFSILFVSPRD